METAEEASKPEVDTKDGATVAYERKNRKLCVLFRILMWRHILFVKRVPEWFIIALLLPPIVLSIIFIMIIAIQSGNKSRVISTSLYRNAPKMFVSLDDEKFEKYATTMKSQTGLGPNCIEGHISDRTCNVLSNFTPGEIGVESFGEPCSCASGSLTCLKPVFAIQPPQYELTSHEVLYDLTNSDIADWYFRTILTSEIVNMGGYSFGTKPEVPEVDFTSFFKDFKAGSQTEAVTIWFNNRFIDSTPILLNSINNVILRSNLPENVTDFLNLYGIEVTNEPMEVSSFQILQSISGDEAPFALLDAFFVFLALSISVASCIGFVVRFHASQLHDFDTASGLNRLLFWTTLFIWDYVRYLVSVMLLVLVFVICKVSNFLSFHLYFMTILLMCAFGWATIPMVYFFSYFFFTEIIGYSTLLTINFVIGSISAILSFVIIHAENLFLIKASTVLYPLFLLMPQFCLIDGLVNIETSIYYELSTQAEKVMYQSDVIFVASANNKDHNTVLVAKINIIVLILQGVLFMILIFLREMVVSKLKWKEPVTPNNPNEDSDIKEEKRRILSKDIILSGQNILVHNVSKTYGTCTKKVGVNHVTFVVERGECFGILGVKGSGKTTILKMISGLEIPSSGEIRVFGLNPTNRKQLKNIRLLIGCSIGNVNLLRYFTVQETLHYYAILKCIPPRTTKKHISYVVKNLRLVKNYKQQVKQLEPGVHSKLLVAIAILGSPPVILLDTPSLHMNASMAAQMWSCIRTLVDDGHLVVITSEYVEECEANCKRFAILSQGIMQCVGTPQHLNAKFGGGFNVVLQNWDAYDVELMRIKQYIRRYVPKATLIEETRIKLHYQVPTNMLYNVLIVMESSLKKNKKISYSLTSSTLNDVYNKFNLEQAAVQKDKELETNVLRKQLFTTLLGCCAFCLCIEFFTGSDLLFDESPENFDITSEDGSDQSSSSTDTNHKNLCQRLCGI